MRTRISDLHIVVLTVAALALSPREARAADAGEDDVVRAETMFREGREAMKSGDYVAACPRFAESQRIAPALGTLLNLALCDEQLGRTASAALEFEQFLGSAPADDDRRPIVTEHLSILRPRVPRLVLQRGPGGPAAWHVTVDGNEVRAEDLGRELLLDPGRHAVDVWAADRPVRETTVMLDEGEVQVRDLESLASPPLATPAPRAAPGDVAVVAPSRLPAYVVGGIGGLGLLAGVVTGFMVLDASHTVRDHCHDDVCDAQGFQANDAGRTLLVVNTVAFAMGAAGIAGGTYLYLSARPPAHASTADGATPARHASTSVLAGITGRF
jgi:hypothetical protein